MAYYNTFINFETYTRTSADITFFYKQAYTKRKKEKAKTNKSSSTQQPSNSSRKSRGNRNNRLNNAPLTPITTFIGGVTLSKKELDKDEVVKYVREGRCFSCYKTGYTRRNYLKRAKEREARVNKIVEEIVARREKLSKAVTPISSDLEN